MTNPHLESCKALGVDADMALLAPINEAFAKLQGVAEQPDVNAEL